MKAKYPLLTVVALIASLSFTRAQSTWDGGGGNNSWTNNLNWSGDVAPTPAAASSALIFTGTNQTSTVNGFAADSQFNGITFNNTSTGGSFTLGGNRITLGGNITTTGTNGTPTHTISLDMILNGNRSATTVANNSLAISGNISETGGSRNLTLSAGGNTNGFISLSGNNTFTGQVTLNGAGKVQVNTLANGGISSSLGSGTSSILFSPSANNTPLLEYIGTTAGGHSTDRAIHLANLTGGARIIANGVGPVTFNAPAVLFSNGTGAKTLVLEGDSTAANTFASSIGNEGAFATRVRKSGVGTWTLSGSNTFSGGLELQSGQLNINSTSAIGTGGVNFNSGVVTLDNTSGGALTLSTSNAFFLQRDIIFGGSSDLSFANGSISSDRSFKVTMNGTNKVLTFGRLRNVGNHTYTATNGAGSGNKLVFGGLDLSTNATARTATFNGNSDIEISGAVVDGGGSTGGRLTYSGTGILTLSGTNTYTGLTTVSSGTLLATSTDALPNYIAASNVSVANAATLAVRAGGGGWTSENIDTLLGATPAAFASGSRFGIDVTTGNSFTYGNNIGATQAGKGFVKTGSGSLTLSGTNTYTGSTTINAGTLLVSAGSVNSSSGITADGSTSKFRYDSSTALTRNVAVTAGATFAYNSSSNYSGVFTQTSGKLGGTNWNGNLGGRTIGANQTITPGNSVGTASTTSQTWASLGSYDWEINKADGTAGLTAGGWDLLNLSSTLTISATSGSKFNINILSLGLDNLPGNTDSFNDLTNYNWLFADSASAISGFSADKFTLNTSGFIDTFIGTFDIALGDTISGGDNTQLYITYTVPEPATWALLVFSLTMVMVLRRRRRQS